MSQAPEGIEQPNTLGRTVEFEVVFVPQVVIVNPGAEEDTHKRVVSVASKVATSGVQDMQMYIYRQNINICVPNSSTAPSCGG